MSRTLSYSEVSAALDCQAKHAFQYTGHLTGGTVLKPKQTAPRLSEGSAWGAGVAAWHEAADLHPFMAVAEARSAMMNSLAWDVYRMAQFGVQDPADFEDLEAKLWDMLDHYIALSQRLLYGPGDERQYKQVKLSRLEESLIVPILSRTGRRRSTRYRYQAKIDGWHVDEDGIYGPKGAPWLYEAKERDNLQDLGTIERNRQYRWYAWTYEQVTGIRPHGILIDERVAAHPKPPRMVKSRKKVDGEYPLVPSHAKDQMCVAEDYIAVCEEHDVEPEEETVVALRARRWQQRVPLEFRPSELEEAGRELVSAGSLIGRLDSGHDYPLRNAKPMHCRGCRFKDICPNPDDTFLVDSLFERRPPKRELPPKEGH